MSELYSLEQFEKDALVYDPDNPTMTRDRMRRVFGFLPLNENQITGTTAEEVREAIKEFVDIHTKWDDCGCREQVLEVSNDQVRAAEFEATLPESLRKKPMVNEKMRICCSDACRNRKLTIECKESCGDATHDCRNQCLRKREWKKVRLVSQGAAGRGLFSCEAIRHGELIIEYTGYLYTREGNPYGFYSKYAMHLIPNETVSGAIVVDPTMEGSAARFIQHSHEPNARLFPMLVGDEIRLGLYAIKNINPDTPITYNYGVPLHTMGIKECECLSLTNCPHMMTVMEKRLAPRPTRPQTPRIISDGTNQWTFQYADLVPGELYPLPGTPKPKQKNTKAQNQQWTDYHAANPYQWYVSWLSEYEDWVKRHPLRAAEARLDERVMADYNRSIGLMPKLPTRPRKLPPALPPPPADYEPVGRRTRRQIQQQDQQQVRIVAPSPPQTMNLAILPPSTQEADDQNSPVSPILTFSYTPGTATTTQTGHPPSINIGYDAASSQFMHLSPLPPAEEDPCTRPLPVELIRRRALETRAQSPGSKRPLNISDGTETQEFTKKDRRKSPSPKTTTQVEVSEVEEDDVCTGAPYTEIRPHTSPLPGPSALTRTPPFGPRSPSSSYPQTSTPIPVVGDDGLEGFFIRTRTSPRMSPDASPRSIPSPIYRLGEQFTAIQMSRQSPRSPCSQQSPCSQRVANSPSPDARIRPLSSPGRFICEEEEEEQQEPRAPSPHSPARSICKSVSPRLYFHEDKDLCGPPTHSPARSTCKSISPRACIQEEQEEEEQEQEQIPQSRTLRRSTRTTRAPAPVYRKPQRAPNKKTKEPGSTSTPARPVSSPAGASASSTCAGPGPSTRATPLSPIAGPSTRSRSSPTIAGSSASSRTPPPGVVPLNRRPVRKARKDEDLKPWVVPAALPTTANSASRQQYEACMRAAEAFAKAAVSLVPRGERGVGRPRHDGWECRPCEQYFSRKDAYDAHIRSHTNLREFPCTAVNPDGTRCTYVAKTADGLRLHEVQHLPEDRRIKFICRDCGSEYVQAGTCTRHMRRSRTCSERRYKRVDPVAGTWRYGNNAEGGDSSEDDGRYGMKERQSVRQDRIDRIGIPPPRPRCDPNLPRPAPRSREEQRRTQESIRRRRPVAHPLADTDEEAEVGDDDGEDYDAGSGYDEDSS